MNSYRIRIYHNFRCSKSRGALEILESQGHAPEIIDYLKHPPTAAELEGILKLLKLEPRELMRTDEEEYETLRLADPSLSRAQLVAAMVEHPILIQRPIVVVEGARGPRAVIGRPPEKIAELLKEL